jgi:hypothetical protein
MAKKFLTPLGLVGLASDPATGSEGQLYFNTTDDVVRVYANGAWTELSGAGGESASVYYQTEAPEGAPLGALWVDSDSTGTGGTGGGTSGTSLLYWTEDNNGNLLPDLDNVYSVGSSAYRVKDLYLGASSLYLQNPASASANISLSVDSSGNLKINDSKIITESNANDNLNLTNYATLEYAQSASAAAVSYLVDSAPGALDTLNELAAALNDDANFATTVTNSLSEKLSIQSASTIYQTKETLITISSDYTASINETIFVNTASTAITVTLPSSPLQGSKIKVLDIAANAQNNIITVLGNGNNIGGASAYIVNAPDSSVEILYVNASKGWNILNEYISLTKPLSPVSVVASNVGTSRPYNNGAATVSFTPSAAGDLATSYTVTSTPGSFSATGGSSPIIVTGLQSNTSYVFNVVATNAAGNSIQSSPSTPITVTTVPEAPTINSVTYGFESADVTFTANETGGSSITQYTVTSNPSSITSTGSSSPLTVSNLVGGTSYTFTVTATNANGTSISSSSSSSTTPFTATGGSITSGGGYRVHTFNATSNFVLTGNTVSCEYLVVAGGGGGGGSSADGVAGGSGGGAGGMVIGTISLSPNTYPTVVGSGGNGGTQGNVGTKGIDSSFSVATAFGGGAGRDADDGNTSISNGGSGGGASGSAGGGAGISTQGSPVGGTGYGNAGGTKNDGNAGSFAGGGGGGAGSAGSGRFAGSGRSSSISGTSTTYAAGGNGQGTSNFISANVSGTANTGNAGNGAFNGSNTGGSGGSGIVIVRYLI